SWNDSAVSAAVSLDGSSVVGWGVLGCASGAFGSGMNEFYLVDFLAASPTCVANCLLQAQEDESSRKSLWRFGAQRQKMKLVSAAGFEPATHALKGRCSTN